MKAIRTLTLRRISVLVLVTLVTGLVIFSWLGIHSVNESINTTLNERLVVARTLAGQLDQTLTYIIIQLKDIVSSDSALPVEEQFKSAAGQAEQIFSGMQIQVADIFLTDKNGEVIQVASRYPEAVGLDISDYPYIKETLTTGEPEISGLVSGYYNEMPVVLISTPIFNDANEVIGAIVCSLDLMEANISPFSQEIRIGKTGYMEIVDQNGLVLARTRPGVPPTSFESSDHPVRFASLIDQGQAVVGTCHTCHENEGNINKQRDILAFAPLQTASWGVAIRQSEPEALSPAHEMEKNFLILGAVLVACTILLALAVMRGVINPIRMLTFAARKVASNDFDAEVPFQRKDEIGELSAAFSNMRQEIAKARDNMMSDYAEAKYKEELRGQLLSSVIAAQEEERKRIARELHDEYGQTLTGLLMNIESLEDMLTPEQSGIQNKIDNAKSILVHTLEDMRKLTLDLRPSSLDDLGLVAAINAYIQMYLDESGIKVRFNHTGFTERLNPSLETAIFRIIQEATHNVVKHAGASRINIDLVLKDDKIMVDVEDDGRGFDVEKIFASKIGTQSWGILGIKERAEMLNGSFNISSSGGGGTHLKVEIPVDVMPRPNEEPGD